MVGLAVWLRGWEGRLTERRLPDYVQAGWLSPPEVAALGSLGRRHSARRWAHRVAGDAGLAAMRNFQFSATRLALLRDGQLRQVLGARALSFSARHFGAVSLVADTQALYTYIAVVRKWWTASPFERSAL